MRKLFCLLLLLQATTAYCQVANSRNKRYTKSTADSLIAIIEKKCEGTYDYIRRPGNLTLYKIGVNTIEVYSDTLRENARINIYQSQDHKTDIIYYFENGKIIKMGKLNRITNLEATSVIFYVDNDIIFQSKRSGNISQDGNQILREGYNYFKKYISY